MVILPSGSICGEARIFIPTGIFFKSTFGIRPITLNPLSTSKIPMGVGSKATLEKGIRGRRTAK